MEFLIGDPNNVDIFFLPIFQFPLELLHQSPDCGASNQHCLESARTNPLPSSKRHCLVQVIVSVFLVEKSLRVPFFGFSPLVLVHVAPVKVDSNLEEK